jgi:hypothetical protein
MEGLYEYQIPEYVNKYIRINNMMDNQMTV